MCRNPEYKKALRTIQLSNFKKYNKEEEILRLFIAQENDFESVKHSLVQKELQIQEERNVPMWASMYQLIIDSTAASLYRQAFLDRTK